MISRVTFLNSRYQGTSQDCGNANHRCFQNKLTHKQAVLKERFLYIPSSLLFHISAAFRKIWFFFFSNGKNKPEASSSPFQFWKDSQLQSPHTGDPAEGQVLVHRAPVYQVNAANITFHLFNLCAKCVLQLDGGACLRRGSANTTVARDVSVAQWPSQLSCEGEERERCARQATG